LQAATTYDLTSSWDTSRVLKNPDKGWYHHYYDNSLSQYYATESDLSSFPGLSQIYLRFAWSYLEPRPSEYNWALIDNMVNTWRPRGYSFSVRITCKETSIAYATPKWVSEMGAQGVWVNNWGLATWEPKYDDPIFLDRLAKFHAAFAARYDGAEWLDLVDIGSYGDWGEGHTGFSSGTVASNDTLKKHIDIHRNVYKKTPLIVVDDMINWRRSSSDETIMRQYVESNNLSYRDDSILVDWYVKNYNGSVQKPEYFEAVWKTRPTILETQHYATVKKDGNWVGLNGSDQIAGQSFSGASVLRKAIELMHATYIGYHGYAAEWLRDNPALAGELANRCGYWLFPQKATLPTNYSSEPFMELTWANKGVAPVYKDYKLKAKFVSSNGATVYCSSHN
jgi:hypothetical protein